MVRLVLSITQQFDNVLRSLVYPQICLTYALSIAARFASGGIWMACCTKDDLWQWLVMAFKASKLRPMAFLITRENAFNGLQAGVPDI